MRRHPAIGILAAGLLMAGSAAAQDAVHPNDAAPLVQVPAGPFAMGNDAGAREEQPAHEVTLAAFSIYRNEVTVGQYLRFAKETGREVKTEPRYGFIDSYPITYVAWEDADSYCRWAGARLPSEAQWEKAARGSDGRLFPWGDTFDKTRAHVGPGVKREPKPVGSYPQGASPYGALDMTGNVDEWVNDRYASDYYKNSPAVDPPGADRGQRVVRGGSFQVGNPKKLTTTTRSGKTSSTRGDSTGFRCAAP